MSSIIYQDGWDHLKKYLAEHHACGQGPLSETHRISFELSNICNYAYFHTRCPLHQNNKKQTLPEKIFDDVLEVCQKYDFAGMIAFHVYNEPGIDPRLMLFIKETRKRLPKTLIFLLSNGFYLDQNLAEEYVKNGVGFIILSAYTEKEYARLKMIELNIPFYVHRIKLDNRLDLYTKKVEEEREPCYAPLTEIIINCQGEVGLCCMDWQKQITFGNLEKESLESCLIKPEIKDIYDNLSCGKRDLPICQRCKKSRKNGTSDRNPWLNHISSNISNTK